MGKLSDLVIPTNEISIAGSEHTLTVRGLSIYDVDVLLDMHEEEVTRAFKNYSSGVGGLNLESLVNILRKDAPEMIPTIIALANDDLDSRDSAKLLPVATQVDCLLGIVRLTVTSVDTVKKILWAVINGLEETNEAMSTLDALAGNTPPPAMSNGSSGKKRRSVSRKGTKRLTATP